MKYHITKEEAHSAKNPHHIFNLNVLLVHLAGAKIILELSRDSFILFLLIPLISGLIFAYIYKRGQKPKKNQTWFVTAHWVLAWRRGRLMLIAYAIAFAIIVATSLLGTLSGGMMMNDFSDDGSSSSIIELIGLYFAAVVVFLVMLVNFILAGISVYDAEKGIIDESIIKHLPRDENSNLEIKEEQTA